MTEGAGRRLEAHRPRLQHRRQRRHQHAHRDHQPRSRAPTSPARSPTPSWVRSPSTRTPSPTAAVDFGFTTTGTGLTPFSLDDDADPTLPNTTTFTGLAARPVHGHRECRRQLGAHRPRLQRPAAPATPTRVPQPSPSSPGARRHLHVHQHEVGFDHHQQGRDPRRRRRLRLHDHRHRTRRRSPSMTTPTRRCPTPPPSPACCPARTRVTEGLGRELEAHRPRLQRPAAPATPAHAPRPITLVAGADITCTFTNTKLGFDHDRQGRRHPTARVDFGVHHDRHRTRRRSSLDDDADADAAEHHHVHRPAARPLLASPRVRSPAGTSPASTARTGGTGDTQHAHRDDHTLVAGADVTCTFTNTEQLGSITIIKDASPDSAASTSRSPPPAPVSRRSQPR